MAINECPFCNKTLPTNNRDRHFRLQCQYVNQQKECKKCQKQVEVKQYLHHLRSCGTKNPIRKCNNCGRAVVNISRHRGRCDILRRVQTSPTKDELESLVTLQARLSKCSEELQEIGNTLQVLMTKYHGSGHSLGEPALGNDPLDADGASQTYEQLYPTYTQPYDQESVRPEHNGIGDETRCDDHDMQYDGRRNLTHQDQDIEMRDNNELNTDDQPVQISAIATEIFTSQYYPALDQEPGRPIEQVDVGLSNAENIYQNPDILHKISQDTEVLGSVQRQNSSQGLSQIQPIFRNKSIEHDCQGRTLIDQRAVESNIHAPTVNENTITQANIIPEPEFCVYMDNDRDTFVSFSFGTAYIFADDIEIVRKRKWLQAGHIWFFIMYLQAKISALKASWNPYFFGPLSLEDIRAGWEKLYSQQDQGSPEKIFASDFLIFPTHDKDHWFLIIASNPCNSEESAVYVLDSNGYDWNEVREAMTQVLCDVVKAANLQGTKGSNISFYQASPNTIPQQTDELCGFYLMAYLEIFARNPYNFLEKIRDGIADQKEPDAESWDKVLPGRFLELLKEFRDAKKMSGRLINMSGQHIITESPCAVFTRR